jgi:hypothetical protein
MLTRHRMALGLYDARGHRKYLTIAEWTAFLSAAEEAPREVRTLCGLLAHTGVGYLKPCGPLPIGSISGRISSSSRP